MADQKSSEDWLPPGWAVEVRVRNNGKRDKCYTDPSKGLKFFSKPEVLRYLNSIEANQPKSDGKIRGSCNGSEINLTRVWQESYLLDRLTKQNKRSYHQKISETYRDFFCPSSFPSIFL